MQTRWIVTDLFHASFGKEFLGAGVLRKFGADFFVFFFCSGFHLGRLLRGGEPQGGSNFDKYPFQMLFSNLFRMF